MKKLIFCFIAIMLGLTFTSCSHQSFKGCISSIEEDNLWKELLTAQIVKSAVDNEDSAFYTTEEDENGHLRSVQVIAANKITGAKYVNTSTKVSVGDFIMLWEKGSSVYLVKCDETLPFQTRIDEARKWCAQNLEVCKIADDNDLASGYYPRLIRLN